MENTITRDNAKPLPATPLPDFPEIVEKHSDFVYNVALRMTGDPSEAEEAMQEAFISAYRAWPRFRGDSQITTWLYRITVNAVLMRRRKSKRERDTTQYQTEKFDVPDREPGPERQALTGELRESINAALAKLPPTLRMAVILRDIQGLSGQEAADILKVDVSALKTRLHRGRLLLRQHLAPYLNSK
ncbi:MAG: sigma-70 family RNA polymerase sigma factor [Chloroflexi bacterium]|nr:sigma-70 family RNA polymerase sigma factor [Chloroflexota bacterium]